MFGQLDDDPKAGTHDGLDPLAGDDPGDDDEDREGREPGDEAAGDEGADDGDESPEQEVARLRRQNRELLNMKSNYEGLRKKYDELDERFERAARRPVDDDEEDRTPVRANPRLVELVQGLRESSPELAELLGHVISGVEERGEQLERKMRELRDEARTRVPARYEKAVARLMRTGEFGSRRAALMAVYGAEYQQLKRDGRGRDDDRNGDDRRERRPERRDEEPPPRSITRRGMSPSRRVEKGVVTMAEHQRRLNEGTLEERRAYLQKYRDGAVKVARKR